MMLSSVEYGLILRRDFMSFIERSLYELNPQTRFIPGLHIEMMAAKLEACRQGKIKRLIINLPPRNLKSHCTSIAFVAWWLAHNSAGHVICASYGQDLADKLARDCRTLMLSSWYQQLFSTRLSSRQAVHDFITTEQGRAWPPPSAASSRVAVLTSFFLTIRSSPTTPCPKQNAKLSTNGTTIRC